MNEDEMTKILFPISGEVNKVRLNQRSILLFRKNKLVFLGNDEFNKTHMTFHFGGDSGYFDIHLKRENTDSNCYYTLIKIKKEEFETVLSIINQAYIKVLLKQFEILSVNEFQELFPYFVDFENGIDSEILEFIQKIFIVVQKKKEVMIHFDDCAQDKITKQDIVRMLKKVKRVNQENVLEQKVGIAFGAARQLSMYLIHGNQIFVTGMKNDEYLNIDYIEEIFGYNLGTQIKNKYNRAVAYLHSNAKLSITNDCIWIRPIVVPQNNNSGVTA